MPKNVPLPGPTDESFWLFKLFQNLVPQFPRSGHEVTVIDAPTSSRNVPLFWLWKIIRLLQRADFARREARVRLADADGSLGGLNGTYWVRTFAAKAVIRRLEVSVHAWTPGVLGVAFKVNGTTVHTLILEENAAQAWVNIVVQPGDLLEVTLDSGDLGEETSGCEVSVNFADLA